MTNFEILNLLLATWASLKWASPEVEAALRESTTMYPSEIEQILDLYRAKYGARAVPK